MQCIDFIERLDLYIDGQLPDEEQPEFFEHIEICADCKLIFDEAIAISNAAKPLAVAKAPDELLTNVMAYVRSESVPVVVPNRSAKKRGWSTLSKALTGVAACAVVVVGVAATMNGLKNSSNDELGYYGYSGNSVSATAAPRAMAAPMSGEVDYGYTGGMTTYSSAEIGSMEPYDMADGKYADSNIGIMPPEPGYGGATSAEYGQKIIKNGNVDLSSVAFDADTAAIESIVSAMGGYMQSSSISGTPLDVEKNGYYYSSGRYGYYTARVPAGGYGGAIDQLKKIGMLEGFSEYSDDITSQYYDKVAQLESYQLQYKTIEGLLTQADNLEDILRIQTELQSLRYKIDALTGSIKQWDFLTSYSTLTITIREVADTSSVKRVDPTLGERIRDSFVGSVNDLIDGAENMVVWIAGAAIVIVVLAVCGGVVVLVVKGVVRRRKKAAKAAEKTESTDDEGAE